MVANNAISSGQIAADLKLRDQTLVQAQTQVDQLAATLVEFAVRPDHGRHRRHRAAGGFSLDTSNMLPGNTINLTYTNNATNTQQQISDRQRDRSVGAAAAERAERQSAA